MAEPGGRDVYRYHRDDVSETPPRKPNTSVYAVTVCVLGKSVQRGCVVCRTSGLDEKKRGEIKVEFYLNSFTD